MDPGLVVTDSEFCSVWGEEAPSLMLPFSLEALSPLTLVFF